MPNGQPTFEFEDNGTRFAFEVAEARGGPLRVRVGSASGDVGVAFDMSVIAAQRFSMMLSAAITRAIGNNGH